MHVQPAWRANLSRRQYAAPPRRGAAARGPAGDHSMRISEHERGVAAVWTWVRARAGVTEAAACACARVSAAAAAAAGGAGDGKGGGEGGYDYGGGQGGDG